MGGTAQRGPNQISTPKLTSKGGGTAINSQAWIEVEGVAHASVSNRILPAAKYTNPIEKGSSAKILARGPESLVDGVDIAIVVRYNDKAGAVWETANHRFGPKVGKVDTSLAGDRDAQIPMPSATDR